MKKAIMLGLVAGFFSGIVSLIVKNSGLFELFSTASYPPIINIQTIAKIEITWGIVWGIIFGMLYAFFYDYIPSEGVKKGLIFGLIIWVIVFLRFATVAAAYGYHLFATPFALSTFVSLCITYGFLIGYLYKK